MTPNKRKSKKDILKAKVGKPPGTLVYTGHKAIDKAEVHLTIYDPGGFETKDFGDTLKAVESFDPEKVNWLNFKGISQVEQVEKLGRKLGFHSLILEDILHVDQAPKIDIYDDHIFATLKLLTYNPEKDTLETDHVSLVLGKNYLISFRESLNEVFKPISDRISSSSTKVKARKADYLLYYLVDFVVDQYYLVMEVLNDEVEKIENELFEDISDDIPRRIIQLKRRHTDLKRLIHPLADSIRILKKYETPLVEDYVMDYFNDVLDHLVQFEGSLTARQETLSGLMDLYMSAISNKMNKVMYTLTIVAAIFIPLTFLAGIYGMNFTNMPELNYEYGYPILLLIMLGIGIGMFVFMKRKKWF